MHVHEDAQLSEEKVYELFQVRGIKLYVITWLDELVDLKDFKHRGAISLKWSRIMNSIPA